MSDFIFKDREQYTLDSDYALIEDDIIQNHKWNDRVIEFKTTNGTVCYISNNTIIANKYERELSPWSQVYPKFWTCRNEYYYLSFRWSPVPHEFDYSFCFKKESELYECIQMIRYCNQVREYDLKNNICLMKEKSLEIKQDERIMNMIEEFSRTYLRYDVFSSLSIYKQFAYLCVTHNKSGISDQIIDKSLFSDSQKYKRGRFKDESLLQKIERNISVKYNLNEYNSSLAMWFLIEEYLVNNIYKYQKGDCYPIEKFSTEEQWQFEDVVEHFLSINHVETQKDLERISTFLISFLYSHDTFRYCKDSSEYDTVYKFIKEFYSVTPKYLKKRNDAAIFDDDDIDDGYASEFSEEAWRYWRVSSINSAIEKSKKEAAFIEYINNKVKTFISDAKIKTAVYNLIDMMPPLTFDIKKYLVLRRLYLKNSNLVITFNFNPPFIVALKNENIDENGIVLLDKFSDVITRKYNIDEKFQHDIIWCIFNYYVLEYYSDKWMNTYHLSISQSQTEDQFIELCLEKNYISEYDNEAIKLLVYYICKNAKSEKTKHRLFTEWNREDDVFMIGKPTLSLLSKIEKLCCEYKEKSKEKSFEERLFAPIIESEHTASNKQLTINDVDSMNGQEFEELITKLFIKMGYDAYTTKISGDQGIDVIAEKNGIKYGIQTKCYSGSVGNAAVQEAATGRLFYGCDKIIVVTNSKFTKSAIELAEYNSVILWDRNVLEEKLIYINQ